MIKLFKPVGGTPAQTSTGFDSASRYPLEYRSAIEAGVGYVNIPTDGLVIYAPLESRQTYTETGQGMSYDGTVSFGVYKGVPCAFFETDGGIAIPPTDGLPMPTGDSPFTLSAWFCPSELRSASIFGIGRHSENTDAFLELVGEGKAGINLYGDGFSCDGAVVVDRWDFRAFTYQNSVGTVYSRSTSETRSIPQRDIARTAAGIARMPGYEGYYYIGRIAACRCYNRVLSTAEIDALAHEFSPTAN